MLNININGAKNSALPILAATLLAKNKYYFNNIPNISDIEIQLDLLKQFNVSIEYLSNNNLIIDTTNLLIPNELIYNNNTRGTYYIIGSTIHYPSNLIYKFGSGCDIENQGRKINYHLDLINISGKNYNLVNNNLSIYGNFDTKDKKYIFENPTVGGTLNGLLIFSKINCLTIFENYAKEPYIFDLINFLIKLGINITYNDTQLKIHGTNNIVENSIINYEIIYDPIEFISYYIFSGINLMNNTISPYTIGPINLNILGTSLTLLKDIGLELIESTKKDYYFIRKTTLNNFNITTDYYPGIFTDVQPFFCLLSLFQDKICTITENIWNNRFNYINELNKLGYNIDINNNTLIINPAKFTIQYNYIDFYCTDLRGGFAIMMLLKMHNFNYKLHKINYITRGYSNFENNLDIILKNKFNIYYHFPTKELSNIKIGGYSKYFSEFSTIDELKCLIQICKTHKINYKIIGSGTNIYFSDYYNGMILKNNLNNISHEFLNNNFININVYSGTKLMDFVYYCANLNIDISQLSGIPGTIGGAIYGNAGAYNLEIKDLLDNCTILDLDNEESVVIFTNNNMNFSYRNSIFKSSSNNKIILSSSFILKKSDLTSNQINIKINDILNIRNKKFSNYLSLGSVFKNPIINCQKYYIWELLDKINFRGKQYNNLKLLDINPNIMINLGNSQSCDIIDFINLIKKEIYNKFTISIETEIENI